MNPLTIILEKADLESFQKTIKGTNENVLALRLDGINIFTATILCNASVSKRLELLKQAKSLYLNNEININSFFNEYIYVSTAYNKSKEEYRILPFICRHLTLEDTEKLLLGLKKEGVILNINDKEEIRNHVLNHNNFSRDRISNFFDSL